MDPYAQTRLWALLALSAVGVALIWLLPRLRRNALLQWLGVALVANMFDISMMALGGGHFTLGWYAARVCAVLSSGMLLGLLLQQLSDAYRDTALSLRQAIARGESIGAARRHADAMLRGIVQAAPGLIYAKDRQGRMLLANAATLELLGRPWTEVTGRTDAEILGDAGEAAGIMATDARIMACGEMEVVEETVGTDNGQPRVWLSTKAPLHDEGGAVIGLVGVSLEISERTRTELRLRLMLDELNHRVKNTLAMVQSIAARTLRGADPALREALEGRLIALARAHDVLTREKWDGADLDDLVVGALSPFTEPDAAQLTIAGPKLRLRPQAALPMALALHELATNAVKYGALSRQEGRVEIVWTITATNESLLRFRWSERGGPPVVLPARRGFGSRMIEHALASDLQGTSQIGFDDPAGVVFHLDAPLQEIAAGPQRAAYLRVDQIA